MRRVTILGGGNGARAAAAEFGIAGHQVTMYDVPQFIGGLAAIEASGRITADGVFAGTAPVRVEPDL